MGQSASQAATFYQQVAANGRLYTLRDEEGCPAPLKSNGERSQPFWSSESRVRSLQKACSAYDSFDILEVSWGDFVDVWVESFESAGILVGLNWSGAEATGYDVPPSDVVLSVESLIEK